MFFESLDKIRRNSIMSAILFITVGFVVLICPDKYVNYLTLVFGYTLAVTSIVMMLNFLSSKKSLMDYIKFTGSLALGLLALTVLVFSDDVVKVLAWLFGFLLTLDGIRSLVHSFTYSRRSERKGWSVLTVLSVLLIISGIVLFFNPWWNTTQTVTNVIGATLILSSVVSLVRLFLTWPLKKAKGVENNEEIENNR